MKSKIVSVSGVAASLILLAFGVSYTLSSHRAKPGAGRDESPIASADSPPEQQSSQPTPRESVDSRFSSSIENTNDWIASLPVNKQGQARVFTDRYSPAYDFGRPEVLAWMIAHKFPTLDAWSRFDFADAQKVCQPNDCRSAEMSALAANHLIERIEEAIPLGSIASREDLGMLLNGLPPTESQELGESISNANAYIDRARENGSVIFSAYLTVRLASLTGSQRVASAARSIIGTCGDNRLNDPAILADTPVIINMIPGALQACGYRPGLPRFPR